MARKGKATYDDLLKLPENVVGEILDGELLVSPRPRGGHAFVGYRLGNDLGRFGSNSGPPGGWWILPEPELHLHGDVVVPDFAGWRVARMPRFIDAPAYELPPDWVCEIASPSTGKYDRTRKMPIYAREGVGHVWIVDPEPRTLEVFRLETDHYGLVAAFEEHDQARAEPFAEVALDLARWWPPAT